MRKSRILWVLIFATVIAGSWISYKYWNYRTFFLDMNYQDTSVFHARNIYRYSLLDKKSLTTDDYLSWLLEENSFTKDELDFLRNQLSVEREKSDSTTTFRVIYKGEDDELGGRVYSYKGKRGTEDLSSITFWDYLINGSRYDLLLSEFHTKKGGHDK